MVDRFKRAHKLLAGDLRLIAMGLSFSTVLSIIPFLAVALYLLQAVLTKSLIYTQTEAYILEICRERLGESSIPLIKKMFSRVMAGKVGTVGLILLGLTSAQMIQDIEMGFNKILKVDQSRSFLKRLVLSWFLVLFFPSALVLIVILKSYTFIQVYVPVLALFGIVYSFYKFIPHYKVSVSRAFMSSGLTVLGLFFLIQIFGSVNKSIFNYSKLYGSLAAFPAFLIFTFFFWYIVLIGALFLKKDSQG